MNNPSCWDNKRLRLYVPRYFPRSLYISLGMVRFNFFRKHLGTIPPSIILTTPLPWHMIGCNDFTSNKQQPTGCGVLRKQYPLHLLEIGAALYFPLPRTKIVATNRRHGQRHYDGAKTSQNWRTTNRRHCLHHRDRAKNS